MLSEKSTFRRGLKIRISNYHQTLNRHSLLALHYNYFYYLASGWKYTKIQIISFCNLLTYLTGTIQ